MISIGGVTWCGMDVVVGGMAKSAAGISTKNECNGRLGVPEESREGSMINEGKERRAMYTNACPKNERKKGREKERERVQKASIKRKSIIEGRARIQNSDAVQFLDEFRRRWNPEKKMMKNVITRLTNAG
jgi:hypothetical protein